MQSSRCREPLGSRQFLFPVILSAQSGVDDRGERYPRLAGDRRGWMVALESSVPVTWWQLAPIARFAIGSLRRRQREASIWIGLGELSDPGRVEPLRLIAAARREPIAPECSLSRLEFGVDAPAWATSVVPTLVSAAARFDGRVANASAHPGRAPRGYILATNADDSSVLEALDALLALYEQVLFAPAQVPSEVLIALSRR